jgi:hypothetical protein
LHRSFRTGDPLLQRHAKKPGAFLPESAGLFIVLYLKARFPTDAA